MPVKSINHGLVPYYLSILLPCENRVFPGPSPFWPGPFSLVLLPVDCFCPLARRKTFWPFISVSLHLASQSLGMFIVAAVVLCLLPLILFLSQPFFVAKYKRQLVFMPTYPFYATFWPPPSRKCLAFWAVWAGRCPFFVPARSVVSCMNMKWSYNPHQTTK